MKHLIILALIALLVGATTASTAKADREGRALIGGLIGGLIIGSVLDDDDRHHHHHRHSSHRRYDDHCGCSGHYDYVSVRTWVNGRWSVYYDSCGHRHRDWRPGHYSYVKKRVWVPHSRGCRHYSSPRHDDHYGNHGRGHGRRH